MFAKGSSFWGDCGSRTARIMRRKTFIFFSWVKRGPPLPKQSLILSYSPPISLTPCTYSDDTMVWDPGTVAYQLSSFGKGAYLSSSSNLSMAFQPTWNNFGSPENGLQRPYMIRYSLTSSPTLSLLLIPLQACWLPCFFKHTGALLSQSLNL